MTAASPDSSVNAASPSALPSPSPSPSAAASERPIRFWLGDRQVSVDHAPPTLTLLEWMRERGGCASVKEGCAEGDCGACTVAVTDLNADGEPQVRAVNACIQFLGTLDGKAVQSAQDIATPDALHPVQQAMVDCHGSQCGFCTPGFVMSMFALYETRRAAADPEVSRDDALRALSGNLCRCTGYRPIVDATRAMCAAPWQGPDMALWKTRLAAVAADGDAVFASGADVATQWPGHAAGRFYAPRTLRSLSAVLSERPQARIVAGSTDVGLWVTKQHRAVGDVVWLGAVRELQGMQEMSGDAAAAVWGDGTPVLEIGAAVSLSDALDALLPHLPNCASYFDRFASTPIRNAGTLVGNLANGSPIGDCPPLMLALGASLVLHRGGVERVVLLDDFYLGYQKNCLLPGEFVRAVRVPVPANVDVHAWKVSKRLEQDISAVAVATAFRLTGGKVSQVRIGVGGMAAVPSRAPRTEAALASLDVATHAVMPAAQGPLADALHTLRNEFAPLDDLRASAAYRRDVAANLLLRSWLALSTASGAAPSAASGHTLADLSPVLMEITP
ncbi:xanthine dehydrogenase small subunit [Pigmentiphaga litoralis]|uniref:xanthine dehydrogenase small subunit n=1 Tax=Pigmentiphaga litoralis TaxID=516702 RepID=UPI00167C2CCC|nr:xanthine dehydrogenase small subunit [Pigmentiphaga litoralis]GGX00875.1 xanthine dehydrogenase small subunit [Pigmentiphaga litoralis]